MITLPCLQSSTLPTQMPAMPTTSQTTEEALNLCVRAKPSSPQRTSSAPPFNHVCSTSRPSPPYYKQPLTCPVMCSPLSSGSDATDVSDTRAPDLLKDYNRPTSSTSPQDKCKTTRPFKAYPKSALPFVLTNGDSIINQGSTEAYLKFRDHMMTQLQAQNTGTNKNMRRMSQNAQNGNNGDPSYWEKRRKNNEAAKRSRDARRAKEDEIAIRCAFLEQENMSLKMKLATMEDQYNRLLYR